MIRLTLKNLRGFLGLILRLQDGAIAEQWESAVDAKIDTFIDHHQPFWKYFKKNSYFL